MAGPVTIREFHRSLKFGDLVLWHGKTFKYWEAYETGYGEPSQIIVEAIDPDLDVFDDRWRYLHLHDDFFAPYMDEVLIVGQDDPTTFIGESI